MRKIDLDFHRTSARRKTGIGLLLLLTGVLMVVWMVILHNEALTEQRRIKSLLTRHHVPNGQQSSSRDQGQETAMQFQGAAAVIEQLSFPWSSLFRTIEKNTGKDMALLAIQPDMTSRTVTLDAEAKDWGGMVRYIKRLEKDGFFSDVHLISHQIQQSDPLRPVRFKLACNWKS